MSDITPDIALNDANTVAAARNGAGRIRLLLDHFENGGTWATFVSGLDFQEMLKIDLMMLSHCVEAHLQMAYAVEPTDFGT